MGWADVDRGCCCWLSWVVMIWILVETSSNDGRLSARPTLGEYLCRDGFGSYFEFMSKAFFHKLPTVLCKIVGVYQIGYHNKVTGKRQMDQAR